MKFSSGYTEEKTTSDGKTWVKAEVTMEESDIQAMLTEAQINVASGDLTTVEKYSLADVEAQRLMTHNRLLRFGDAQSQPQLNVDFQNLTQKRGQILDKIRARLSP